MASSTPITTIPNLAAANIDSTARTLTVSNGLTYLAPISGFFYNNAIPYSALSSSPLSWTYSGNLGVGTTTPTTKLQVNGVVTATGFAGNLTGNVTGNASTATLATSAATAATATLATSATNATNASTATLATSAATAATATNATNAANATNATNATTATTVSDNAITTAKILNANVTAAKLNGAQTGTAPIYGVRAWVTFAGNRAVGTCPISASGNVTSVTKIATGQYSVRMTTAMPFSGYAVVSTGSGTTSTESGRVIFTLSARTLDTFVVGSQANTNGDASGNFSDSTTVSLIVIA